MVSTGQQTIAPATESAHANCHERRSESFHNGIGANVFAQDCQLCGARCGSFVRQGPYQYWKCSVCGVAQLLPQPCIEELRAFYRTFHLSTELGGEYDEVEARMQADFPAKVVLAQYYTVSGEPTLLDVGCGKGFFVKVAQDLGFEAECIDISETGIEHARDVLGVRATCGRLEEQMWSRRFDIVTLWATIEHVPNPTELLRSIRKTLRPGGVLLCDTGLGDAPWESVLPGYNQWYDAPQHLFVFTERSLCLILRNAGFEVLAVDTNFERSLARRIIRRTRHTLVSVSAYLATRPLLGSRAFQTLKQQAKWPIGRLMSVVATPREDATV